MSDGSPIPGWYADPQDPARLRWWDGSQWTSHTQPYPLESGATSASQASDHPGTSAFGPAAGAGGVAGAATAAGAGQFGGPAGAQSGQFGVGGAQPGLQAMNPQATGQPMSHGAPGQFGVQPPEAVAAANEWGGQAGFGSDQAGYAQPGQAYDPYGTAAGGPAAAAFGQGAQPPNAGYGQQEFSQAGFGQQGFGQPGYGANQPGFGSGQPAYGSGQPGYGAAQPSYGAGQGGYGQQNYGYSYGYDQQGGYAPIDTGHGADRNKLIIAGLIGALAASLLGGLLWLLFGRGSGSSTSGVANTTSTAPFPTDSFTGGSNTSDSAACASLVDAMTANNQPTEVSVRLQELASNVNASDNAQYFTTLESDLAPARDSYQQDCLADIASGRESSTYRSFVTSFDRAVSDGATLGQQIAATNTVDPAQARTLTDNATQLEQATASLPATSSAATGAPSIPGLTDQGLSAASPFATPSSSVPTGSVLSPNPSQSVVDPFASPITPQSITPTPVSPQAVTPTPVVPVTPTPVSTPTPDSALAQQDNAADEAAQRNQSAATK